MRTTAPEGARRGAGIGIAPILSTFAVGLLGALLGPPLLSSCVPGKGTIGAVIAQDDASGRLFLRDVPAGLAAAKADLKSGDEILLIDGLDVRTMSPQQIHAALTGEVDSTVKLTLIRDEQVLRVTLKRTEARKFLNRAARARASENAVSGAK